MSPASPDLRNAEKSLKNAIDKGKIIRLISYAMTIRFEKTMDLVISCILNKYKKARTPVYCIHLHKGTCT